VENDKIFDVILNFCYCDPRLTQVVAINIPMAIQVTLNEAIFYGDIAYIEDIEIINRRNSNV